jgi:hypothetical protein
MVLMIEVDPVYHYIVLRAAKLHAPWMIDQILAVLAAVWVTYAMVTVGLIAVFAWDALSFDRRDALVLGPLPVPGTTIIAAKLAALVAFLLAAAAAVNVTTGVPYALVTSDRLGFAGLARQLTSHLTATMLAAIFVFAAIVTIRGTVALLFGARVAARLGSVLQFLFVSALLCFVLGASGMLRATRPWWPQDGAAGWIPPTWFLGLFEHLRGSPRPEFTSLAARALVATLIAIVGSVIVSVAGFRRQLQLALAPGAFVGAWGTARVSRTLARWLAGGNATASATTDFILMTLVRNRAQQAPIAMNAAVGVAIVVAALFRNTDQLASLMRPRTAVLWMPLVLAYWTIIGLRASFFVPSELAASWSFRANAPEHAPTYWSAVRASMTALVVPPILLIAMLLVPLVGWPVALWHALITLSLVILLVDVVALTIDHIPFTRPYPPGHAKLRSRWPIYLLGMFAFAYYPVRLELALLGNPTWLLAMVGCIASAIVGLEIVGRRAWCQISSPADDEASDDPSAVTVLNIGGA